MRTVTRDHLLLVARMLWASPCSIVGLALGGLIVLIGGSCRRVGPTLEFALAARRHQVPALAARLGFAGITFGHVILGQSHEVLSLLRAHERVHVRQYETMGVFFFLAYPAASLAAWIRGECPYRGNRFEREAVAQSHEKPVR